MARVKLVVRTPSPQLTSGSPGISFPIILALLYIYIHIRVFVCVIYSCEREIRPFYSRGLLVAELRGAVGV